jgi:hypothetical protein
MKLPEFIGLLEKYPEKDSCRFYDIKNNDFLYYRGYTYSDFRIIIYLSSRISPVSYKTVIQFLARLNKSLEVEFILHFNSSLPGVLPIAYDYELASPQTGIP